MDDASSEVSLPSQTAKVATTPLKQTEPEGRTLAARVQRSILRLAPGRIRNLNVSVRRGTIFIYGRCSTFYCKQIAQHAAMELAEGEQVQNLIEVA